MRDAVTELSQGLVDADLGGCLFKKRIAKAGTGKRGGYRVLLAFRFEERVIFLFGFNKADRENIDQTEKFVYQKLARYFLRASKSELKKMLHSKQLFKVE